MVEIKEVHEILKEMGYKPNGEHKIIYDSAAETLEPIYFFILSLMGDFDFEIEKLVDTFTSSPGSGHFSELSGKATHMQQQASKTLQDIGILIRGVLTNIYDMKEFKMRLHHYNDIHSNNKERAEAGKLALKQVWMDQVDIKKGNTSIKALSFQGGFQTLLDAFLLVQNEKLKGADKKELDLNDRVKRLLRQRIVEFDIWLNESEKELRKRYEIQKNYLRSQVNNLKLYARWAKPYLKTAAELEQRDLGKRASLVKAFNTILLQLTILGKREITPFMLADEGKFTKDYKKLKIKRKYYQIILVDFEFTGIPQKVQGTQHYSFGGNAEVIFRGYALSEDDLAKLDLEISKTDMGDILRLIEGTTDESLEQMQQDIDEILEDKEFEEKMSGGKKKTGTPGPFAALFGSYDKPESGKKEKPKKAEKPVEIIVRKDTFGESELRKAIATETAAIDFLLFDIYKKAHGMVSWN